MCALAMAGLVWCPSCKPARTLAVVGELLASAACVASGMESYI